jgi:tetratricopeptide (TPR) repeat protein
MVGALLMLFVIIPVELVPGASKAGDKLVLWRESAAAINHAPIFGFGSASFQDIFPYIDTIQRHEFARNVESALLQVLIEQGVIPSMVLFGAIALLFIRTTRDHRFARRYMFPSFIGITVFLVLDVSWGMSLQAESYAIIAAALVGAVAGRPKKAGRAIRQRQSGWAAAGTIALTGIICAFGISSAIETSLADSELPFAEVQQREDIPPALEEAGKSRPLNLVVLAQSTGLHAAVEQFERADAIVLFLVDEAPQRQIVWRAAFKISAQDGSSLDKCDLVNRYWKEFGELPAEIANVVRSEPAFAECIVAREESEQCSVIAELLPMLNSDERFLLVNRMMEVERSECVLGASVELSIGSPFSPLAENWVAELEDMGDLQAETHLTLARHYESRGAHDKELQHLLAAREILDDNAQVGLEVLEALIGLVRSEQAPNGWYQRFTAYSEAVRLDTFQDSELAMKLRRLDAEAAYLADDVERAKEEFDSLRNAGSEAKRAETHLYLARIAREQGRYRDAINAYRMTLRFEPQNEEAKQALEELNATVR